jgi:hypothetical protein
MLFVLCLVYVCGKRKHMYEINIKENRSVNQEWTIQRHWLQLAQQDT